MEFAIERFCNRVFRRSATKEVALVGAVARQSLGRYRLFKPCASGRYELITALVELSEPFTRCSI
ncbi:hypothetical protein PENSPDRAFT_645364 [Peniophora sp. CONT]|nr:hypothetical protein PENSPDRAFT_645364 [Peniophora sp. CONT]